jgi:hypothetical protein
MIWLLLALAFIPGAEAVTIGVSPSQIDLGMAEPGKSYAVEFTIINPEKKAASFSIEETDFVQSTKSYRIKGKGSAKATANVKAPMEPGAHDIPIVVLSKSNDALIPGLTIPVRMRIAQQEDSRVTILGHQERNTSLHTDPTPTTHFIMSSQTENASSPNVLIGLEIVAGILGLGLVGFFIARKSRASHTK